jgi:hypothetical protein
LDETGSVTKRVSEATAGVLLAGLALAACLGSEPISLDGPSDASSSNSADAPADTSVAVSNGSGVSDGSGSSTNSEAAGGSVGDASSSDAISGADASTGPSSPDASSGSTTSDAADASNVPPVDASCSRTCPTGFECLPDQCLDRAVANFSTLMPSSGNWSYGYSQGLGAPFQPDTEHFVAATILDVWTNSTNATIEPSVFHNGNPSAVDYASMTVPADALGLYPSSNGQFAVVRWTAPATGMYQIEALFTGVSTPASKVDVGLLINGVTAPSQGQILNSYGAGNTFGYSGAQMLDAGEAVDFYVGLFVGGDDSVGGVTLDAQIAVE